MHMIFFSVGFFLGGGERVGILSIRLESKVHFGMKALFFTQTQSSSIVDCGKEWLQAVLHTAASSRDT